MRPGVRNMPRRDIVLIGASAGGLESMQELVAALPAELRASLLVVLHTSKHAGSVVPEILNRKGKFRAIHPEDGARIEPGQIYVAPPDFHMIVEDGHLRVIQGPRENRHRPAIDPLFRSAAAAYGPRVAGVILSGLLDDGTAGLMVVRAAGGEAIVQDPDTALFSSMPRSALRQVPQAHVASIDEIANLLLRLSRQEVPETVSSRSAKVVAARKEVKLAEASMSEIANEARGGSPSQFACPDCGGVLWEMEDSGFLRFRCRVGHAFTAAYLDAEQQRAVEGALWAGLRALEERSSLYKRMAELTQMPSLRLEYETSAGELGSQAKTLRDFLVDVNSREEERPTVERSA